MLHFRSEGRSTPDSRICGHALAVLLLLAVGGCDRMAAVADPDFHKPYITLPSGDRAYCNPQGYRETIVDAGVVYRGRDRQFLTEKVLVTDTNGNFVKCDPEAMANRHEDGSLITDEERAAMRKAEEDELLRQKRMQKARSDWSDHAMVLENSRPSCPETFREENKFYEDDLKARQRKEKELDAVDWAGRREQFEIRCAVEAAAIQTEAARVQAQKESEQAARNAISEHHDREKRDCQNAYDAVVRVHNASQTPETASALSEANRRMQQCYKEADRRWRERQEPRTGSNGQGL